MSKVIELTDDQIAELETMFAELRESKPCGSIIAQIFRDGMRVSVLPADKARAVAHALKPGCQQPIVDSVYK